MNATPRPDCITRRSDAAQLWMHLLERGIFFHWEEDPSEWSDGAGRQLLAEREIATMRRLFAEVDRLGAETFVCYADADSLRQLAMLGALPRPVSAPTSLQCRSRQKVPVRQPELRFAA